MTDKITCGAKTRSGAPCKKPPRENGRCRYHGGLTPKGLACVNFKHGMRSRIWGDMLNNADQALLAGDMTPVEHANELVSVARIHFELAMRAYPAIDLETEEQRDKRRILMSLQKGYQSALLAYNEILLSSDEPANERDSVELRIAGLDLSGLFPG